MIPAQSAEPIGSDGLPQVWCELHPGAVGTWANVTDMLEGAVTFPLCPPGWYNELRLADRVCPIEDGAGVTLHVVSNLTIGFQVTAS